MKVSTCLACRAKDFARGKEKKKTKEGGELTCHLALRNPVV